MWLFISVLVIFGISGRWFSMNFIGVYISVLSSENRLVVNVIFCLLCVMLEFEVSFLYMCVWISVVCSSFGG